MVAGSMEVRLVLPCLDIIAEFWCCLAKWMDGCETSSTKKGFSHRNGNGIPDGNNAEALNVSQ